ncbi:hypothetical protein B0O99DRAFT_591386 [Bisporella sp. PMI_857]|nr:hypothetical protein B0O99DRAFT_591386 [Bisporella sp. PMI_857]
MPRFGHEVISGNSSSTSTNLLINNRSPSANSSQNSPLPSEEDEAVCRFFEKFVIYPCHEGSSPGFLEHLPSLFKEAQVEGRLALRWAVRVVSYAGLSSDIGSQPIREKALHCYGLALASLGDALSVPKREPDDYVLMTVVVLDLFERREQLATRKSPLSESEAWLQSLNDELPYVRNEITNYDISRACGYARSLLGSIDYTSASVERTLSFVKELHDLDQKSTTWRARPSWSFKSIHRSRITQHDEQVPHFPDEVQLHRDIWIAYEWNYRRTARIILHEHLLQCLDRLQETPLSNTHTLVEISFAKAVSKSIIISLVDKVLSTVPQSLGDIDHEGHILKNAPGVKIASGIGGYFLLWPIRVIKKTPFATTSQHQVTNAVFERIRECTGMKETLGDASSI